MSTTPGAESKKFGSMNDHFHDASEEVGYDSTPDSGVHESLNSMDPEQRARQEEEWREQLAKTEDEILTLRQVLASKVKESQELKRKLGITVWREFKDDLDQGVRNVKETEVYKNVNERISEIGHAVTSAPIYRNVNEKMVEVRTAVSETPIYQKTETAVKTAAERTTSVLGTIGASVSRKLGDVKNSQTFKSFEERVGSAYSNVKERVSGSRSNSVQSFEEALEASERSMSRNMTPAATPTIPENKPLV